MADSAAVASATEDASSANAATDDLAALSEAWATLTSDVRKARYGVAYVRSICAQPASNSMRHRQMRTCYRWTEKSGSPRPVSACR